MITLPVCRWRDEATGECGSAKLIKPPGWVPGDFCGNQCPYVDHEPGPDAPPAAPAPRAPCIHRGEPTGQLAECPSCTGTVRVKIFACSALPCGTCTLEKPVDGHGCCSAHAACPGYTAPDQPSHAGQP